MHRMLLLSKQYMPRLIWYEDVTSKTFPGLYSFLMYWAFSQVFLLSSSNVILPASTPSIISVRPATLDSASHAEFLTTFPPLTIIGNP